MTDFLKILRNYIEHLSKEYRKLESSNKNEITNTEILEEMNAVLDLLTENMDNIRELDTDKIVDYFYTVNEKTGVTKEEYNERLHQIKVLLKGNYDSDMGFELYDEQREFLHDFASKLHTNIDKIRNNQQKKEIKKQKRLEKMLIINEKEEKYKILQDKILSKKALDLDDFELIYKLTNGNELSPEKAKTFLIGITLYMQSLEKNIDINLGQTNIEEFIKLLKEDYHLNDSIIKTVLQNKNEITKNSDITEVKNILEFLSNNNLLNKFDKEALLSILTYGTLTSVSTRYTSLIQNNNNYDLFYKSASGWVDKVENIRQPRHSKKDKTKTSISQDLLKCKIYEPTPEDQALTVSFLTSKEFPITLTDAKVKRLLNTHSYIVIDNYNILKNYDIFKNRDLTNFPLSVFSFSSITSSLDRYIEAGLHDYVYNYPTALSRNSDKIFAYLFKTKESSINMDEYYSKIYSSLKSQHKFLNGSIISESDKIIDVGEYLAFSGCYKPTIENEEEFNNAIIQSEDIFDPSKTIIDEHLQNLDDNYKQDEYTYIFNNAYISRIKVLRNYGILQRNGLAQKEGALIYSITRNSLLTKNTYDIICSICKEETIGVRK